MEEQKKEKSKITKIIIYLVLLLTTSLLVYIEFGLGLIWSIIIGSIILISFLVLKHFGLIKFSDKRDKEKEKQIIDDLVKLDREELKDKLRETNKSREYLEEALEKKKVETVWEKIEEQLKYVIQLSTPLILLGIFYFGAIPTYFNVNNEFTNPTNSSLGLNVTMNHLKDIGIISIDRLMHTGQESPAFWFWAWWVGVCLVFIYPIIEFTIWLIRRRYGKKR